MCYDVYREKMYRGINVKLSAILAKHPPEKKIFLYEIIGLF